MTIRNDGAYPFIKAHNSLKVGLNYMEVTVGCINCTRLPHT